MRKNSQLSLRGHSELPPPQISPSIRALGPTLPPSCLPVPHTSFEGVASGHQNQSDSDTFSRAHSNRPVEHPADSMIVVSALGMRCGRTCFGMLPLSLLRSVPRGRLRSCTPWPTATHGEPPYRNKDGLPRGFGAGSMQGYRYSPQPFDGDSRILLGRDTQQGMIQMLHKAPAVSPCPSTNLAHQRQGDHL